MENRTNMEDDRVAILEAQVAQAKLIAEEADKKYEEVWLFIFADGLLVLLSFCLVTFGKVTNDFWHF